MVGFRVRNLYNPMVYLSEPFLLLTFRYLELTSQSRGIDLEFTDGTAYFYIPYIPTIGLIHNPRTYQHSKTKIKTATTLRLEDKQTRPLLTRTPNTYVRSSTSISIYVCYKNSISDVLLVVKSHPHYLLSKELSYTWNMKKFGSCVIYIDVQLYILLSRTDQNSLCNELFRVSMTMCLHVEKILYSIYFSTGTKDDVKKKCRFLSRIL